MSWAVSLRDSNSEVYGIDPYYGDEDDSGHTGYNTYINLMKIIETNNNILKTVELIVEESVKISSVWDKEIDVLHIAGFHTYESIKIEYDNWSKHIKADGVVLYHFQQDQKAEANEFFKELEANEDGYSLLFTQIGLGLFVKERQFAEYIMIMFQSQ